MATFICTYASFLTIYRVLFFTGFELLVTWHSVKGFWRSRSQPIHKSLKFKTITKFALPWGNCDRHGAKRNELEVKSLFSQLCTGFQMTRYLRSYLFFPTWLMEQKKNLIGHIIDILDEPALRDPAMMLLDGLLLKQFFFLQTRRRRHFIKGIDYKVKNKHFLFHKPHRKNQELLRYCVVWKPLFDCENKVLTASSFHFAPRRLQLSHWRTKFVIVIIPSFDDSIETKSVKIPSMRTNLLTVQIR